MMSIPLTSMRQSRSIRSNEYYDILPSPIGNIYFVFCADCLCEISFEKPRSIMPRQTASSSEALEELREYFNNGRKSFNIRTRFNEGTEFEREVWEALLWIPYGETRTYKWLAEKIGKPRSSRAVGRALGKNPIPIIFPCHRIIESDGSIGGYTPGTDIKRRLLEIEYYTALAAR